MFYNLWARSQKANIYLHSTCCLNTNDSINSKLSKDFLCFDHQPKFCHASKCLKPTMSKYECYLKMVGYVSAKVKQRRISLFKGVKDFDL